MARGALRIQRGVSLIESLIVLAVSTVALGSVLPGFGQARDLRRLEAVAAQVETDIHHARSLAVARGAPVRISFDSSQANASCYVVHTGSAGDCRCDGTGAAVCRGSSEAFHTVRLGADTPVQLASNSSSVLFDGARGTVTPTATIRVHTGSAAVHQVVNIMGRVRSCSPAPVLPGYRSC